MKHLCYKRYNGNIIKKKFNSKLKAAKQSLIIIYVSHVPVAQWLEHCVSSAKVVGSIPREHILTINVYAECTVSHFG